MSYRGAAASASAAAIAPRASNSQPSQQLTRGILLRTVCGCITGIVSNLPVCVCVWDMCVLLFYHCIGCARIHLQACARVPVRTSLRFVMWAKVERVRAGAQAPRATVQARLPGRCAKPSEAAPGLLPVSDFLGCWASLGSSVCRLAA